MKTYFILILSVISFVSKSQVQWNQSGDNYSMGRLGIGTSTPASDFDIDIFRTNPNTGIKMFNSNWAGRSIVLFGQGLGGKYGYIAHHGQSYVTSSQAYRPSSTVLVGSDVNGLGVISYNDIRFYSGGDDDAKQRMIINASGFVGIGNPSPSFSLDVQGFGARVKNISAAFGSYSTLRMQGPDYTNGLEIDFFGNNNISSDINWSYGGGAGSAAIVNVNPKPLVLGTNNQCRVLIDANGNVGIGSTSPDQKLTVNGTIHSKEVKVDLSVPGPDYVFEKDYDLLSLTELETYINQNKHLPEVPSAKEMEKDGLNLKEMNLILLKKVEELTLFAIEANKKAQVMQNEINELKKIVKVK
jgi:hypothetical protein